jgi:hypothetical protein
MMRAYSRDYLRILARSDPLLPSPPRTTASLTLRRAVNSSLPDLLASPVLSGGPAWSPPNHHQHDKGPASKGLNKSSRPCCSPAAVAGISHQFNRTNTSSSRQSSVGSLSGQWRRATGPGVRATDVVVLTKELARPVVWGDGAART